MTIKINMHDLCICGQGEITLTRAFHSLLVFSLSVATSLLVCVFPSLLFYVYIKCLIHLCICTHFLNVKVFVPKNKFFKAPEYVTVKNNINHNFSIFKNEHLCEFIQTC